jgi:hypothetical protein
MLKLVLIFCATTLLLSCSKENENNGNNADTDSSSISFKLNGTLIKFSGSYGEDNPNYWNDSLYEYATCKKELNQSFPSNGKFWYIFTGQHGMNQYQNDFMINLTSDSLTTGNFRYDSINAGWKAQISAYINKISYSGVQFSKDSFNLSITSYSSGRISGTFSARLTPMTNGTYGVHGSTIITDGILNNVKVRY